MSESKKYIKQADLNLPYMLYFIVNLCFIIGLLLYKYIDNTATQLIAIIVTIITLAFYIIPLIIKCYLNIGSERSYAIIDFLDISKERYKTRKGVVQAYPCLYMHLESGEQITYEFGDRLPNRDFEKDAKLGIKIKGHLYNPIIKLY